MLVLGIALVCLTLFAAIAIGAKANKQVHLFDESGHEPFLGTRDSQS